MHLYQLQFMIALYIYIYIMGYAMFAGYVTWCIIVIYLCMFMTLDFNVPIGI